MLNDELGGSGGFGFSLVLGAGGRPGLAYLAGTLLALELHGIRPNAAASITGTSAGSIATAVLAAGGSPEDLAAYSTGATPRPAFRDIEALIRAADAGRTRLDRTALWQLIDPRRGWHVASELSRRRWRAALIALVPGLVEITHRFSFLDSMSAVPGSSPLWRVVAADLNGRRHVFTRGEVPLSLAVAASCAVPGLFAPIRHQGRRLLDGGVHSTTNADLAVADDGSTVIVIAPMCVQDGGLPVRGPTEVTLRREIDQLVAAGKRVVTFRPSTDLRGLMGSNPLAVRRSREITGRAVIEAVDVLAELPALRHSLPRAAAP